MSIKVICYFGGENLQISAQDELRGSETFIMEQSDGCEIRLVVW